MAFELIYTSAPQGIRPGSSGFCIVAYTNGLAANVALQLESLSAYKYYFPHYDENAAKNPVAFSHYIYDNHGEELHILSRICFNGLDYTKRSNKLAHHLVMRRSEWKNFSPAAPFYQNGLFLTQWSGPPQLIAQQKTVEPPELPLQKAGTWEAYTGDAGWAGVIASRYLESPEKNVFILYDPLIHTDILSLVSEALNLLPPQTQWKVSFHTYFSTLPPGIRCNWRFCVPGSDALRDARKVPDTLVIDLTKKLPSAGNGELQEVARTGIPPRRPEPTSSKQPVSQQQEVFPDKTILPKKSLKLREPESPPEQETAEKAPVLIQTYKNLSSTKLLVMILVLAFLFLILLAGAGVYIFWKKIMPPIQRHVENIQVESTGAKNTAMAKTPEESSAPPEKKTMKKYEIPSASKTEHKMLLETEAVEPLAETMRETAPEKPLPPSKPKPQKSKQEEAAEYLWQNNFQYADRKLSLKSLLYPDEEVTEIVLRETEKQKAETETCVIEQKIGEKTTRQGSLVQEEILYSYRFENNNGNLDISCKEKWDLKKYEILIFKTNKGRELYTQFTLGKSRIPATEQDRLTIQATPQDIQFQFSGKSINAYVENHFSDFRVRLTRGTKQMEFGPFRKEKGGYKCHILSLNPKQWDEMNVRLQELYKLYDALEKKRDAILGDRKKEIEKKQKSLNQQIEKLTSKSEKKNTDIAEQDQEIQKAEKNFQKKNDLKNKQAELRNENQKIAKEIQTLKKQLEQLSKTDETLDDRIKMMNLEYFKKYKIESEIFPQDKPLPNLKRYEKKVGELREKLKRNAEELLLFLNLHGDPDKVEILTKDNKVVLMTIKVQKAEDEYRIRKGLEDFQKKLMEGNAKK